MKVATKLHKRIESYSPSAQCLLQHLPRHIHPRADQFDPLRFALEHLRRRIARH